MLVSLVYVSGLFAGGAEENMNSIVVATDATWPPMEYINDNKEVVGFAIDMFNEVADRAGLTVEYLPTAWDGIFAGLSNGAYDAILSSVTITDERKEVYDFSIPYINAGQILVVRSDFDPELDHLEKLGGYTVGAQIATTGAFEVEKYPDVNLSSYDDVGLAFQDLVNGRIDGVVADTPVAANFALQSDAYKGVLKIVGEPYTSESYGIVFHKDNDELRKRINTALQSVIDDGIIEELTAKWLR